MNLKDFMIAHEGYRELPYEDTEGVLTVGIGFNLKQGLDDAEIDFIFGHRSLIAEKNAVRVIGLDVWNSLNKPRQFIIISMCYQLGRNGLSKFRKMIAALERSDYDTASKEMLNSLWARQTPNRAQNHSTIMKRGSLK